MMDKDVDYGQGWLHALTDCQSVPLSSRSLPPFLFLPSMCQSSMIIILPSLSLPVLCTHTVQRSCVWRELILKRWEMSSGQDVTLKAPHWLHERRCSRRVTRNSLTFWVIGILTFLLTATWKKLVSYAGYERQENEYAYFPTTDAWLEIKIRLRLMLGLCHFKTTPISARL